MPDPTPAPPQDEGEELKRVSSAFLDSFGDDSPPTTEEAEGAAALEEAQASFLGSLSGPEQVDEPATEASAIQLDTAAEKADVEFRVAADEAKQALTDSPLETLTDNFTTGLNNNLWQASKVYAPEHWRDTDELLSVDRPFYKALVKDGFNTTLEILDRMGIEKGLLSEDEFKRFNTAVTMLAFRKRLPMRGTYRKLAAQSAFVGMAKDRLAQADTEEGVTVTPEQRAALEELSTIDPETAERIATLAVGEERREWFSTAERDRVGVVQDQVQDPARLGFKEGPDAARRNRFIELIDTAFGPNGKGILVRRFDQAKAGIRDAQARVRAEGGDPTKMAPTQLMVEDDGTATVLDLVPGEFIVELKNKQRGARNSPEWQEALQRFENNREALGDAVRAAIAENQDGDISTADLAQANPDIAAAGRLIQGLFGAAEDFGNLGQRVRQRMGDLPEVRRIFGNNLGETLLGKELGSQTDEPFGVLTLLMKSSIREGRLVGPLGQFFNDIDRRALQLRDEIIRPGAASPFELPDPDPPPDIDAPAWVRDVSRSPAVRAAALDADVAAMKELGKEWNAPDIVAARERLIKAFRGQGEATTGELLNDFGKVAARTLYVGMAEPVMSFIDHPERAGQYLFEGVVGGGALFVGGRAGKAVVRRALPAYSLRAAAKEVATFSPAFMRRVQRFAAEESDRTLTTGGAESMQKALKDLDGITRQYLDEFGQGGVSRATVHKTARSLSRVAKKSADAIFDPLFEVRGMLRLEGKGGGPFGIGRLLGLSPQISRATLRVAAQEANDIGAKSLKSLVGESARPTARSLLFAQVVKKEEARLGRSLGATDKLRVAAKVMQDDDIMGVHDFVRMAEGIDRALASGQFTRLSNAIITRVTGRAPADTLRLKNALEQASSDIVAALDEAHGRGQLFDMKLETAEFLYGVAKQKGLSELDSLGVQMAMARELNLTDDIRSIGTEIAELRKDLSRLAKEGDSILRTTPDSKPWDLRGQTTLRRFVDDETVARAMELRPEKFGGLQVEHAFDRIPVEKGRVGPRIRTDQARARRNLDLVESKLRQTRRELDPEVREVVDATVASSRRTPEVVGEAVARGKNARKSRLKQAKNKRLVSRGEARVWNSLHKHTNSTLPVDDLGRSVEVAQAMGVNSLEGITAEGSRPILHHFLPAQKLRAARREVRKIVERRLGRGVDPRDALDVGDWLNAQVRAGRNKSIWKPAVTNLKRAARDIRQSTGMEVPVLSGPATRRGRGTARRAARGVRRREFDIFLERQVGQADEARVRMAQNLAKDPPIDLNRIVELEDQANTLRDLIRRADDVNNREPFFFRARKDNDVLQQMLRHDGPSEFTNRLRSLQQSLNTLSRLDVPSTILNLRTVPLTHQLWATKQLKHAYMGEISRLTMQQEELAKVLPLLSQRQRRALSRAMRGETRVPKELLEKYPSLGTLIEGKNQTVLDLMQRSSDFQHELLEMARATGLIPDNVYSDLIGKGYNPHYYTIRETKRLVRSEEVRELGKEGVQVGSPAQTPVKGEVFKFQRDLTKHRARVVEPDGRVVNELFETEAAARDWLSRNYGKVAPDRLSAAEEGLKRGKTDIGDEITLAQPLGPTAMRELGFKPGMTAEATLSRMRELLRDVTGARYLQALKEVSGQVFSEAELNRLEPTRGARIRKDLLQLPNRPDKFGSLAGHFVHKNVYSDISTLGRSFAEVEAWAAGVREGLRETNKTIPDSVLNKVAQVGGLGSRLMEVARSTQITYNHLTWVANATFNILLDQMIGARTYSVAGLDSVEAAFKAVRRGGDPNDPLFREWVESGISGTGFFGSRSSTKLDKALRKSLGLDDETLAEGRRMLDRREALLKEKRVAQLRGEATQQQVNRIDTEVRAIEVAIERLDENKYRTMARGFGQLFVKRPDVLGDRGVVGEAMRQAYSDIDEIGRYATYRQLRKRMSKREALWHVEKFMQNYRDVPGAVQRLGSNPIIGSFAVGFPAELVRLGTNFARYKGSALVKMAAVIPSLNMFSAGAAGVDLSKQIRHQMQLYGEDSVAAFMGYMSTLNVYGPDGEIATSVDLSNTLFPQKDMLTFRNNVRSFAETFITDEPAETPTGNFLKGSARAGASVAGGFFFNAPVGTALVETGTGVIQRLRRQVFSSNDTFGEKAAKWLKHHAATFVPPLTPVLGRHMKMVEDSMSESVDPDLGKVTDGLSVGRVALKLLGNVEVEGRPAEIANNVVRSILGEIVPLNTRGKVTQPEDAVHHAIMTTLSALDRRGDALLPIESESRLQRRLFRNMIDPSLSPDKRRAVLDELLEEAQPQETRTRLFGELYTFREDPAKARKALERLATGGMYDLFAALPAHGKAAVLESQARFGQPDRIMKHLADLTVLDRLQISMPVPDSPTTINQALAILQSTDNEHVARVREHLETILPAAEYNGLKGEVNARMRMKLRDELGVPTRKPIDALPEEVDIFRGP